MEVLVEEHSFLTKIEASKYIYKYKWTIQNFNLHNKRNGEFIKSPTFQTSNNKCYMKLYPDGFKNYSDYLAIYLHFKTNMDSTADVMVDFGILNNKQEVAHNETGENSPRRDCLDIGCLKFIKQSILYDASKSLLLDNQLTILCTITKLLTPISNAQIGHLIPLKKSNEQFNLFNDLKQVLDKKLLTDITLTANGKEMHAHKIILVARSSVFEAMLQNDMKEKENSKIEIEDVKADILSKMLEYMYTDKVTDIEDHYEELLYLANKYDIRGLKLLCEQTMIEDLTVENFVEDFMLAEAHCCKVLKQEILKFIINNAGNIIETPQFETWRKDLPQMVIDIIEANA